MFVPREKNRGQDHKIPNKSVEMVKRFKYLRKTITSQNCIYEEIKSILNSGNACYHLVWSLLSSSLLPRNMKIKNIQNYNFCL
jgi:hypothetical protein